MCGIWGWVAKADKGPNLERIAAIVKATESRGRHAFGFAWVDGRGVLRAFKQQGQLSEKRAYLRFLKDARMIIGHCRYATHGDPENNLNNHPFPADGGWLVHNGVIGNHEQLCERHDLEMITECDSETLALMVETFSGSMISRCANAVGETLAESSLAMMGLWARPNRLIAIRRGNPLHVGEVAGGYYLASLDKAMPSAVASLPDSSGLEFCEGSAGLELHAFKLSRRKGVESCR